MITAALALGVDDFDRATYPAPFAKTLAPLDYAEQSARTLGELARAYGAAPPQVLVGRAATGNAMREGVRALVTAAKAAGPGATVLLSFSGHGIQRKDRTGKEKDGLSEHWCLWDAPLRDAAIVHLLAAFPRGATVVVVSDCCFSEGIVNGDDGPLPEIEASVVAMSAASEHGPAFRAAHDKVSAFVDALKGALLSPPPDYPALLARLTRTLGAAELQQTPGLETIGVAPGAPPFWQASPGAPA